MKLIELIEAVKERNLDKDQLENYRDQLSSLFAQMQFELADIEKEKAMYFDVNKTEYFRAAGEENWQKVKERSDVEVKRMWQVTQKGLREIELKRYCLATKEMLNSLKSRLYSIY